MLNVKSTYFSGLQEKKCLHRITRYVTYVKKRSNWKAIHAQSVVLNRFIGTPLNFLHFDILNKATLVYYKALLRDSNVLNNVMASDLWNYF